MENARRREFNYHYVDAIALERFATGLNVAFGELDQFPLLPKGDRFLRRAKCATSPRSYLDEDECFRVLSYYIDLAQPCPNVALADAKAVFLEVIDCCLLANSAQDFSSVGLQSITSQKRFGLPNNV